MQNFAGAIPCPKIDIVRSTHHGLYDGHCDNAALRLPHTGHFKPECFGLLTKLLSFVGFAEPHRT
jgi:hypothetical protein